MNKWPRHGYCWFETFSFFGATLYINTEGHCSLYSEPITSIGFVLWSQTRQLEPLTYIWRCIATLSVKDVFMALWLLHISYHVCSLLKKSHTQVCGWKFAKPRPWYPAFVYSVQCRCNAEVVLGTLALFNCLLYEHAYMLGLNTSCFKIPFSVCRGHWWGGCALSQEVIQQVLNGAKQIKQTLCYPCLQWHWHKGPFTWSPHTFIHVTKIALQEWVRPTLSSCHAF